MDYPLFSSARIEANSLLVEIATRTVVHLPTHESVGMASGIMAEKRISSIVVTDDAGRPVGILTESNILHAMQSGHPREDRIGKIMSAPIVTVPMSTTALEAYQICLRRCIRHLVIVDENGLLAGVVSESDFRLHLNLSVLAGHRLIASSMSRSVLTMDRQSSLKDALSHMQIHRDSCLVVVEENRPVGILTERDIVRLYALDRGGAQLGEVMTSPVRTISIDDSVNEAAKRMIEANIRHLAVVDEMGCLAGIVSEHDLTQTMMLGLIDDKTAAEGAILDTLVDAIPDLVWLKDADGVYLACNTRFENYYGSSYRDIIGKSAYDFLDREMADLYSERDRVVLDSGKPVVDEEWLTFASDGYRGLFETVRTPMRDANGSPLGVLGIARDITERVLATEALREREELFSTIVNQAADSIVLIDSDTLKFAEFNPVAHESLGYTREEFSALTVADVQAQLSEEKIRQRMQQSIEKDGILLFETVHRRKDGSFRHTQVSSRPIGIRGKTYLSAIWSDITERKRAEENLRLTASVFDNSQEGIVITDAENRILDVNPAFTRITGYSREEALGKNPRMLQSGRESSAFFAQMWDSILEYGSWRGEIWNRRKSGEVYAELLSISVIRDENGKTQRHVAIFSDISHFKAHEEELARIAHYDALTGIPNRVLLADRMKQAMAQTMRDGNLMAICYLDLDGFKAVNDDLGHAAGDQVLIEVAKRIKEAIRGGDTVARLGGDEFVVLLLDLEKGEECVDTLDRLHSVIGAPMSINGHTVTLGASIGVSIFPQDDEDAETLLRHADQAMYAAKQAGKHRFHIYDPFLDLRARDHREFVKSIRIALDQDQLELHYQPKINLLTRDMVGAEALIRWRHPERGLLSPGDFLSAVQNTDLDIEIGEWVIHAALEQSRKWKRCGLDIEVSINLSPYHMESPGFVEKLQQKLSLNADSRLQIELMETAALANPVAMNGIIEDCRRLGVGFALDDFGTGNSSLSRLNGLPVDSIKIDRSFVKNLLENKNDNAFVHGIIALARAFERQIVAEGIESAEQYRALLDIGCEFGQGYGIAKPMAVEEFENWRRAK